MAVFLFCFYFVLIFSRLSLVSAPAFGDWNVASSQQCHQEGEAASGMRQKSPCFIFEASSIYGSDPDTNLLRLWARQPGASPYRPTRAFSSRNVLIAIPLLSSGKIESNPGPPSRTTSNKTKLQRSLTLVVSTFGRRFTRRPQYTTSSKTLDWTFSRYRKLGLALTLRQP